jgi:hypothetical protein
MSSKPRRLRTLPRIPKSRRMDVTRAEFNHVIDLLNERGQIVDQIRRELDIQFKRIAQMQFELDGIKKTGES